MRERKSRPPPLEKIQPGGRNAVVLLWLMFMTFSLFWCFLAVGFYGIMRYVVVVVVGGGVYIWLFLDNG